MIGRYWYLWLSSLAKPRKSWFIVWLVHVSLTDISTFQRANSFKLNQLIYGKTSLINVNITKIQWNLVKGSQLPKMNKSRSLHVSAIKCIGYAVGLPLTHLKISRQKWLRTRVNYTPTPKEGQNWLIKGSFWQYWPFTMSQNWLMKGHFLPFFCQEWPLY